MNAETYERIMASPDPLDHLVLGCNDCDEYISLRQFNADPAADIDWVDGGDDGVWCPKCGEGYRRDGEDE